MATRPPRTERVLALSSCTVQWRHLIGVAVGLAVFCLVGVASAGDPSNFASPCDPLPDDRTPNDGVNNDGGWVPVDFCTAGATGAGPAAPPDCHHNDDDSASQALSFSFSLYGSPFASTFINNNGNLSFGNLFSTFTATGFPVNNFPMVAPFWGDVDTGDQNDDGGNHNTLGHVWTKSLGAGTFAVTWDNVGYFNEHADKSNTFQVVISDGLNPALGLGNNVCFCYDDMQWTTGDASGGVGGFGGVPATVGANKGDGIDFFQIGRFDHPGVDYDGPFGSPDGVDFLDGQGAGIGAAICFNASGENIPPVAIGFPANDTITVECPDIVDLTVEFLSPEADQTTTVVIDDPDGAQAAGLVIVNTPGNMANIDFSWTPDPGDSGTYEITLTATDDQGGETVKVLTIIVDCPIVCDNLETQTQGFWRRVCKKDHPAQPDRSILTPELCEDLNPDPNSDPCEKARSQCSAVQYNVLSDRLDEGCTVDATSDNVAAAIDEAQALIAEGTNQSCKVAQGLCAGINEGGVSQ